MRAALGLSLPAFCIMLRLLLLLLVLVMARPVAWAQLTPTGTITTPSSEALLLKSRHQRNTARVLLLGGGLVAGAVIYATAPGKSVSFDVLPLLGGLGVAGGAAVLSSIPLFAAASRNKRKAAAAVSLQLQPLPPRSAIGNALPVYPAVVIRLRRLSH
jgi:hypothetical protein